MTPATPISDGAGAPGEPAAIPELKAAVAAVAQNPVSRLSHRVFLIAAGASVAVALVGMGAILRHQGAIEVKAMGVFFACIAVLKYMVAARAISTPLNPDGSSTRDNYVTAGRFRLYVIMKVVAATLALAASIIILRHGAAHLS